jgi:hypothetical protein
MVTTATNYVSPNIETITIEMLEDFVAHAGFYTCLIKF